MPRWKWRNDRGKRSAEEKLVELEQLMGLIVLPVAILTPLVVLVEKRVQVGQSAPCRSGSTIITLLSSSAWMDLNSFLLEGSLFYF